MMTTTATYLSIASNLSKSQAATAADPTVKRETAYYLANIGKAKTISDFVNNYQLFSYAMKAYGLGDMTYAKGLMTKVLEGGISNSKSLANTITDPRFRAFAAAFNFAANGSSATSTTAATTGTTAKYIEQALEDNIGKQNQGVQLALYFQRMAPSVTSAYGILADKALLQVVQTTFGLAPYGAAADIDTEAREIGNVLNIKDLQDPAKVQKLVERFTAMWDLSNNTASGAGSSTIPSMVATGSLQTGFSVDLLQSLQGLKLGGS
jgi:hypothetical protein